MDRLDCWQPAYTFAHTHTPHIHISRRTRSGLQWSWALSTIESLVPDAGDLEMDFSHLQMRCLRSQFNLPEIRFSCTIRWPRNWNPLAYIRADSNDAIQLSGKKGSYSINARACVCAYLSAMHVLCRAELRCTNETSKSLFRWFSHRGRCELIPEHDVQWPLFYGTPTLSRPALIHSSIGCCYSIDDTYVRLSKVHSSQSMPVHYSNLPSLFEIIYD